MAGGGIDLLVQECHAIARSKGFWDDRSITDPLHNLAALMLIDTEVAEAAEAVRKGDDANFSEELADIVIRVFDLAGAHGINLEGHIGRKMEKNRGRDYKHGKRA